jgi:hypothetical protein
MKEEKLPPCLWPLHGWDFMIAERAYKCRFCEAIMPEWMEGVKWEEGKVKCGPLTS